MEKVSIFSLKLRLLILTVTFLGVLNYSTDAQTCASVTGGTPTFSTNFDTLANTGTSSTVPTGIGFVEAGTNANTTYTAGTGSSATGETFSFGAAADTDRAFGGIQSGTLIPTVGGCITNNTGANISSITITYDGEQWRLGNAGRVDRLDFQYSTDAASLATGTWTDVDTLDFIAPITVAPTGALNGNAAANRTAGITSTIIGLNIVNGAAFYFRYLDFNATGADDGLAIDNFSLTTAPSTAAPATVSGRVLDSKGRGVSRVQVKISGGDLTAPLSALTNPFGYFSIEIPTGQTYIVNVSARGYTFSNPTQVINVNDSITNLMFTASGR